MEETKNNNNNIIVLVVGVLLIGGIVFFALNQKMQRPQPTQNTQVVTRITPPIHESLITVSSSGFTPVTTTVKLGTNVVWVNKSGKAVSINSDPHPTHNLYRPLNLGEFNTGSSVQLIFDKAGTYTYHNHLNPSQKGTIIVM